MSRDAFTAYFRKGLGNGSFGAAVTLPGVEGATTGIPPYGAETIDVNNDGFLDVVTQDNRRIATRLGNGDGTFRAQSSFASGNNSSPQAIGDINGDGVLDVLSVHYRVETRVYLGDVTSTTQMQKL